MRKTGEGWCQVNTLGREVNSWTQPQRALWMGNKGVYSLGEGKASSSLSKTHSAPQRKPVLMWNSSPAPRQYYCLPNQRAPAREQEPTSTKERGKPEGTHPSHWPCSVSHLSAQRRSPSGVALRSPFSAHLWFRLRALPSQGLFCHPAKSTLLQQHRDLAQPLTHLCPSGYVLNVLNQAAATRGSSPAPAGVSACKITGQAGMGIRS